MNSSTCDIHKELNTAIEKEWKTFDQRTILGRQNKASRDQDIEKTLAAFSKTIDRGVPDKTHDLSAEITDYPTFVVGVAAWLADLKTENEAIDPRDPFQLNEKEISKMPIKNYLERLTRELNYNPNSNNTDDVTAVSCLIMTMYHLDLYCKLTGTVLNQYNQHALLLISSAVTHKYFDEIPYSDDDIAIEIGLMSSMKRYKKLECLFLKRIDWGVGATSQKIVPLMSIDVIYKQYKTTILEYFFGHGMNDLPGPPVFRFA